MMSELGHFSGLVKKYLWETLSGIQLWRWTEPISFQENMENHWTCLSNCYIGFSKHGKFGAWEKWSTKMFLKSRGIFRILKRNTEWSKKSVTILIACHSHNYWRIRLCFGHVVPNICRFYSVNIQVKRCNGLLTGGASQKFFYFGTKTNDSHNITNSAASVAWNLVTFPDASSFPGMRDILMHSSQQS